MSGVDILVVAGLGALGALIRWGLWLLSSEAGRPWAIVLANTLGGLLAGLAIAGAFGSCGPVLAARTLWRHHHALDTGCRHCRAGAARRGCRCQIVIRPRVGRDRWSEPRSRAGLCRGGVKHPCFVGSQTSSSRRRCFA